MATNFTDEDLRLLMLCNSMAGWGYWRHAKLFYALKDALLLKYGTPDGYDLQWWEDGDYYEERDAHAAHKHILERWKLRGQTFHKPTDEFAYFNYEFQTGKHSERFYELIKLCVNRLEGRRLHKSEMPYTDYCRMRRAVGWPALKFLIKRFGYLLRAGRDSAVSGDSAETAAGSAQH